MFIESSCAVFCQQRQNAAQSLGSASLYFQGRCGGKTEDLHQAGVAV